MAVRKLTVVAMLTALICIVGPLTLPVGPIPVSLTSAVLLLTACLLGGRRAALCAGVYLLIGLTGLPVLAGFTGGAARLLGPTGGFLLGYLPLAGVAGAVCTRTERRVLQAGGMLLGLAALYTLGTGWYCLQAGVSLSGALTVCVWPFLPFEGVKLAAVLLTAPSIRRRLVRAGLLKPS